MPTGYYYPPQNGACTDWWRQTNEDQGSSVAGHWKVVVGSAIAAILVGKLGALTGWLSYNPMIGQFGAPIATLLSELRVFLHDSLFIVMVKYTTLYAGNV